MEGRVYKKVKCKRQNVDYKFLSGRCLNTGVCLPGVLFCNFFDDCGDNSDEDGCPCDSSNDRCKSL